MKKKNKIQNSKLKYLEILLFKFLILTFALAVISACSSQKEKIYRKSMILMDTVITITAVSDSGEKAEIAIDKAFSEIEKLDNLLNFFFDKSEVSEINKNAGVKPTRVSPETFEMIEKAVYGSEKTNGAFDITIGPVVSLWDFHEKIKPEDRKIRERLHLTNYKNIILNKKISSVYLIKKGMFIDPGGIAKGYAADKAEEVLKQNGIKSGLVSVAGDIKAFGLKPDGKPWKIGIRDPRGSLISSLTIKKGIEGADDITATIELTDMAISTSGDYERYFILNNKRYHHILDPKTGYPAGECRSVSVIAKNGSITDPFSTGIFVLGPEKGLKLLEDMKIDGIIIDKDGKIHTTFNLRGKIEIKRNN